MNISNSCLNLSLSFWHRKKAFLSEYAANAAYPPVYAAYPRGYAAYPCGSARIRPYAAYPQMVRMYAYLPIFQTLTCYIFPATPHMTTNPTDLKSSQQCLSRSATLCKHMCLLVECVACKIAYTSHFSQIRDV